MRHNSRMISQRSATKPRRVRAGYLYIGIIAACLAVVIVLAAVVGRVTLDMFLSRTIPNLPGEASVPIVVYHIVRPSYEDDDASVRRIAVTPETFEAELAYLRDAGYHPTTFHALETYLASSTPLPSKPIIICFDDGWQDQYVYAFPILEKYHDTATFFVYTNGIGKKSFLSWSQLSTLVQAGMTIGDHSKSHPYLTKIASHAQLVQEIVDSKYELEDRLGISVDEFAYPFGQYNPAIIALIKKAGFKSARGDYSTTTTQSLGNEYTLGAINAPTTLAAFKSRFP